MSKTTTVFHGARDNLGYTDQDVFTAWANFLVEVTRNTSLSEEEQAIYAYRARRIYITSAEAWLRSR